MEMKHTIKRLVCAFLVLVMISCFLPTMTASAASAGSRLQGLNKTVYDFLKKQISSVAAGTLASAEFTLSDDNPILKWTKADLGVSEILSGGQIAEAARTAMSTKLNQSIDFNRINSCLLADCPYELFWYDKSKGAAIVPSISANESEIKITKIQFKFTVTGDYAAGEYGVDTAKINAVTAVVDRAKAIVAKYAAKSDLDKLVAYKDEICNLVDYNHTVANNPSAPYSNAYQLINVFDNDPNTKVVCEGYAKAFKYLCDLSSFKGDVSCYLVNGYMQGGTGAGNHTWNVVQIDGGMLLVDVTNCDTGTVGFPDQLFLKVGKKNGNTYSFKAGATTVYYVYGESENGLNSDGYLELKAGNTIPVEPTTKPTEPATVTHTVPAPTNPPATVPSTTQPTVAETAAPTIPTAAPTVPVTKPVVTQTSTTAPTVPSSTTPTQTQPATAAPTVKPTEPAQTAPVATEPAATKPEATETVTTVPIETVPTEVPPVITAPTETQSTETLPEVIEPVATEPMPSEAMHTEPIATDSVIQDDSGNNDLLLYIVIGGVCAAAIAVAVVLILKKKKA